MLGMVQRSCHLHLNQYLQQGILISLSIIFSIVQGNLYEPSCFQAIGYFWDQQQCVQCADPNCYCSEPQICEGCAMGYYLNDEKVTCFKCPMGCRQCCKMNINIQISCSKCEIDYILLSGFCKYMPSCLLAFTAHGRCKQCIDGFYLDSDGTCSQCHFSCKTCRTQDKCDTCANNFYDKPTSNSSAIIDCSPCNVDNCKLCNNNLECIQCSTGFTLIDDKCLPCKAGVGCTKCITPDYCLTCTGSSVLVNRRCTLCNEAITNCDTCKLNQEKQTLLCQKCETGFYLNNDKLCQPCPEFAQKCISDTKIIECFQNYLLVKNTTHNLCVFNQQNCRQMDQAVYLATQQIQCVNCLNSKYFVGTKKECLLCDLEGCNKCISVDQVIQCQECHISYTLSQDHQCIPCSENCFKCNFEKCLQCLQTYVLGENDLCRPCNVQNCDNCQTQIDKCDKCAIGYGLFNLSKLECQHCQVGCKKCDYDLYVCTECERLYQLQNNYCIQYPDHCLVVDNNFQCQLCEAADGDFYVAQEGKCVRCSDADTGTYNCPSLCQQYPSIAGAIILSYLINVYIFVLILDTLLQFQ